MKKLSIVLFLLLSKVSLFAQVDYDVCIYGGTSAGVVAGVAAKRLGLKALLIEPTNHVGGMTTGGLGETDIGNKYAITGIAKDFYRRLGKYYGKFDAWQFEPSVADKVFNDYIQESKLEILYLHRIVDATTANGKITRIIVENSQKNEIKKSIRAHVFIDCSYEGDLMAKAKVSYFLGREDNQLFKETLNGVQFHEGNQLPDSISPYKIPNDPNSGLVWGIHPEKPAAIGSGDQKIQAYNFRLCLTNNPSNRIPFDRPIGYDSTQFELLRRVIQKRHALGWKQRLSDLYLRIMPMPNQKTDVNNKGGFSTDLVGGSHLYPEANYAEREKIKETHVQYTKSLLYFLSHDPALPTDLRNQMLAYGWPKDEFLQTGGFPDQLYVREARRLKGNYVMTEQHCRHQIHVSDGVGMAAYQMDSHNCERHVVDGFAKNEGDVQEAVSHPFNISFNSMVPKREECVNLLVPVCLSATHVAYGSIRMEPVFMVMAQAAALGAWQAIKAQKAVQDIHVKHVQQKLKSDPLFDGSVADIFVDNEDTLSTNQLGNWTPLSKYIDKMNRNCILAEGNGAAQQRFTFQTKVPMKGKYELYFYTPNKGRGQEKVVLPSALPIQVKYKGKMLHRTLLNQAANEKNWSLIGTFDFEPQQAIELEVLANGLKEQAIVDAIVLIKKP